MNLNYLDTFLTHSSTDFDKLDQIKGCSQAAEGGAGDPASIQRLSKALNCSQVFPLYGLIPVCLWFKFIWKT